MFKLLSWPILLGFSMAISLTIGHVMQINVPHRQFIDEQYTKNRLFQNKLNAAVMMPVSRKSEIDTDPMTSIRQSLPDSLAYPNQPHKPDIYNTDCSAYMAVEQVSDGTATITVTEPCITPQKGASLHNNGINIPLVFDENRIAKETVPLLEKNSRFDYSHEGHLIDAITVKVEEIDKKIVVLWKDKRKLKIENAPTELRKKMSIKTADGSANVLWSIFENDIETLPNFTISVFLAETDCIKPVDFDVITVGGIEPLKLRSFSITPQKCGTIAQFHQLKNFYQPTKIALK